MLACTLAAIAAWACGSPPSRPGTATEELSRSVEADRLEAALAASAPEVARGALVVRLAFGAEADLDLFVSDPHSETVYFAKREARSGGSLQTDLRCDARAPRIETVRFEHPLPGRYRIGVDYPEACSRDAKPAPFVVEWRHEGNVRLTRGLALPLVFDSIVTEFDLAASSGARGAGEHDDDPRAASQPRR